MATPQQPPASPAVDPNDPYGIKAAIAQAGLLGGGGQQFLGLPTNANVSGNALEQQVIAGQPDASGKMAPYAPTAVTPRYFKGAEWMPVMANATPQEIAQLQRQLVQGGLLNSDYQNGVWDNVSQNAFQYLLAYANNAGTDYQTALNGLLNAQTMTIDPVTGQPVVKKRGTAAMSLELTNPDDVATTAQNVAQQFLGRPLSTQELQRFQSIWTSEEKGYQTTEYGIQATGGTATKPASMQTEAQRYAESIDPTAYQGQQAVQLVQHLNTMLGGISGLGQPKAVTAQELGVQ